MGGAAYIGLKLGVGRHSSYQYCVLLGVQSSENIVE